MRTDSDLNGSPAETRVFAVERALMLLQCFECADETRTLASLAKQSGLYKSTILRLATSMCKMGFLVRQPSRLFALGPELTRLASIRRMSVDIEPRLRLVLRRLAANTEGSASFHIRQGRHRICLFHEPTPHSTGPVVEERIRVPLNSGAVAQVLRACSKHSKDPDLIPVRRRGLAASRGDRHPNWAVVATPVFNREKELLGALAVKGSLRALTNERQQFLREAALTAARALMTEMRFVHPADLGKYLAPRSVAIGRDRDQAGLHLESA
jgi:DNA-binding IclR family transcriptional regulator